MKKVLAFAASTSQRSINKRLVTYAGGLLIGTNVEVVDLNEFPLPLFSEDVEREIGQPENARLFFEKIGGADALLISFAEHNGSYTAAFKNLFDWCSRISPQVYQNKPVVMLATSPGGRGGANVLELASKTAVLRCQLARFLVYSVVQRLLQGRGHREFRHSREISERSEHVD